MELFIKNMVCDRCILAVENELKAVDLEYAHVRLGNVLLKQVPSKQVVAKLEKRLTKIGFEILTNHALKEIEDIKRVVLELVTAEVPPVFKYSQVIGQRLNKEYNYLSQLFSSIEGMTLERFIILQKIERVKELISYGQFNFSEIAYNMGYSSVAHLSAQFKKETGLTPSNFKKRGGLQRLARDQVKL